MKQLLVMAIVFLPCVFPYKAIGQANLETVGQLGVLWKEARFVELVKQTPLGAALLPSTLDTGWSKNWIFRFIIYEQASSLAPNEIHQLLAKAGVPQDTLEYLRDQEHLQLVRQQLIQVGEGAKGRLTRTSESVQVPIEGPLVGGPMTPVEIPDAYEFLQTYERIRTTSYPRRCEIIINICVHTDGLSSFSVGCEGLQFELTTRGELFFSASSPDGRSVKLPVRNP